MKTYQYAIAILLLVGVIVAVSFIYPERNNTSGPHLSIETVSATHTFSGGTHTYSGTLNLPSPCYDLDTDSVIRESFPEHVTLIFEIIEPAADGSCAQVIDPRPFKIVFDASKEAAVAATLNGKKIPLDIREATSTIRSSNSSGDGQRVSTSTHSTTTDE